MKNFNVYLLPILSFLLSFCAGNSEVCEFEETCVDKYNNLKSMLDDTSAEPNSLCSHQQELKDCSKKLSRKCRGDLNYHFFDKLVRDLLVRDGLSKNCSSVTAGTRPGPTNGDLTSPKSPTSRGRIHPSDKCAPKTVTNSFAGCALYGLTNVKSFSQALNQTDINYCSLPGAWSLIDTPEFAVQITNKGGLRPLPKDITTTTLATVIIKTNQCSQRKTYQATFDETPGMFSDGYTTAGNVYIETMRESEHVKIHFPYLQVTIDIIKVIGRLPIPSLSVTIKMPQSQVNSFVNDPGRLRGLPLCFYGCPKTATIIKPRSADTTASLCANYDGLSSSGSTVSEFPSGNPTNGGNGNGINEAICASFNSVQNLLSESTVVGQKLAFPGEENFGSSSSENPVERFSVENSALTSQSVGLFYGYYRLIAVFSLLLYFTIR